MSEQTLEHQGGTAPNTLTTLGIERLREDLEALFSCEGAEAGWIALQQLVHGEEQEGDLPQTPPAVTGREAFELVMGYRKYFPEVQQRYFDPSHQRVFADIIARAVPDARVTLYDGPDLVSGTLKVAPRALTDPRQPYQLEVAIVDYDGEIHIRRAYPGQLTVHTDET